MEELIDILTAQSLSEESKNKAKRQVAIVKRIYYLLLPNYKSVSFVPPAENLLKQTRCFKATCDSSMAQDMNLLGIATESKTETSTNIQTDSNNREIYCNPKDDAESVESSTSDRDNSYFRMDADEGQQDFERVPEPEPEPKQQSEYDYVSRLPARLRMPLDKLFDAIDVNTTSLGFASIFGVIYLHILEDNGISLNLVFPLVENFVNEYESTTMQNFLPPVEMVAEFISYYGYKTNLHRKAANLLRKLRSKLPKRLFTLVDFWLLIELSELYSTLLSQADRDNIQTQLDDLAVRELQQVNKEISEIAKTRLDFSAVSGDSSTTYQIMVYFLVLAQFEISNNCFYSALRNLRNLYAVPTKSMVKLRYIALKKLELVSLIVFGDANKTASAKFASPSFDPYVSLKAPENYDHTGQGQSQRFPNSYGHRYEHGFGHGLGLGHGRARQMAAESESNKLGYPSFTKLYQSESFSQVLDIFELHKLEFEADGNLQLAQKVVETFPLFKLHQLSLTYSVVPLERVLKIVLPQHPKNDSLSQTTLSSNSNSNYNSNSNSHLSTGSNCVTHSIIQLMRIVDNTCVGISITPKSQTQNQSHSQLEQLQLQQHNCTHHSTLVINTSNYLHIVKAIQAGKFSNNVSDYVVRLDKPLSRNFVNGASNTSVETLSALKSDMESMSLRLNSFMSESKQ